MRAGSFRALTLAIHPNSQGFGWVAFSSPLVPYDWGNVGVQSPLKNEKCLRRIERLFDRLSPATLVLEAIEADATLRRPRLYRLHQAMIALAASKGIEVATYTFAQVRHTFVQVSATSRSAIAHTVGRMFIQFAHLVPAMRRAWHRQPWRLSLFCAAALVLTHFQRDAMTLLESLKS